MECGTKNRLLIEISFERYVIAELDLTFRGKQMFFSNKDQQNERHGTVIAALGINPKNVTETYLESLAKEFGCTFEKGDLLIWVEASEKRAEEIFDILRKRNSLFD